MHQVASTDFVSEARATTVGWTPVLSGSGMERQVRDVRAASLRALDIAPEVARRNDPAPDVLDSGFDILEEIDSCIVI